MGEGDTWKLKLDQLTKCQEDFSSNARTDILGKYSRFHGKTEFSVWCNAPDVKYIDSFRDIIYEISPHHITCVYKKVFETAALNNLRLADGITCEDGESIDSNGTQQDYTGYSKEHVDKSNSCVYSTCSGVKTIINAKGNPITLELNGWDICDRPHVQGSALHQKPFMNETLDTSRRYGKSPRCRTFSPPVKSFPAMMRLTRHHRHGNGYRNGSRSSSPRIPSREDSSSSNNSDACASHSSSSGSINNNKVVPIKIWRRFRHFRRNSNYMEQYREEYTNQRLRESRDFSNFPYFDSYAYSSGSSACSLHATPKTCDQRWSQSQSHLEKTPSTCERNPCITSGVPLPKRTPVMKTRPPPPPPKKKQPYVAQIPKLGDAPKSSQCFQRETTPKLEFFATSFTVNNYNPVKTPPSPAHKSASNSASSLLIMNCGRGSKSPVQVSTSCMHLLNQNLKGVE